MYKIHDIVIYLSTDKFVEIINFRKKIISPLNFFPQIALLTCLKQQSRKWTIADGGEKEGMSQID